MSHIMHLTDRQWYNFICGMQAGLKLRDLTLPSFETDIVLKPIGVGGYGQIGIAIPQVVWDGVSLTGLVPVFTHDVDIGYAGFSCKITWDNTRLNVVGLVDGDFGAIGTYIDYTLSPGSCHVVGLREAPTEYTEPMILFYLSVVIIDTNITKDNPIPIKLVSGNGYDINYTTLIKYVLNPQDNNYYSYFITPIKNIDGAIVSEKENVKAPIGDEKTVAAPSSPSGVFIGTSFTTPGDRGVVPIVTNSNVKDNFPYNGIQTRVIVEDSEAIFTYLRVVGVDGWTLTTTTSTNENGYLVLDIIGNRDEAKTDSITVGYIEYAIGNKDGSYLIPLRNVLSKLFNATDVLNCFNGSGAILYNDSGDYGTDGSGGIIGTGGAGGIGGGGPIWSDSEQIIWIGINDTPKYPIYLKPGWNEVHFWIPFIFPDDEWVEAQIIIEAGGYLLIPTGFEFNIKIDKNAPEKTGNPKMIDSLSFTDLYDIEIQSIPVPVDLDNLINEIVFEDIHAIDIINATILAEQTVIEDISFEDVHHVEIQGAPFTGEVEEVEEINFEDVITTELINTDIILKDDNIEEINFEDEEDKDIINVDISNKAETENIGFNDFVDIDYE